MLRFGLVSVTFRDLEPETIIGLVKQAGLSGIEWGGDVHVLPGDLKRARRIGQKTKESGLTVAAYGSYYRLGESEDFETVLTTAKALGAPVIRVWAGRKSSKAALPQEEINVYADACRVAALAKKDGIRVACEYHENTLNDGAAACQKLLAAARSEDLMTYWQPLQEEDAAAKMESLAAVLPHLANMHVHHRQKDRFESLGGIEADLAAYLRLAGKAPRDLFVLIEFVAGGTPQSFLDDAALLRRLGEKAQGIGQK